MKKQLFFLGAILGFSITLIGGYASGSQDCKNVLCLLKAPDGKLVKTVTNQQDQALKQVWKKDPIPLKVSPLTLLESVSSQELNKKGLKTDEDGYQGVTWAGDSFAQKALDAKKADGIMQLSGNIWVAPVSQVQTFFKTSKGSITNKNLSKEVTLRLRILQYLGLILDRSDQTYFVTIIAKKSDIRRPCSDPEIDDAVCQPLNTQAERKTFMEDKNNQGLIDKDKMYPWTGLGYTYDWGNPNDWDDPKNPPIGASEYVIKKGVAVYVYIKSVERPCNFLKESPLCK